MHDPYFVEMIHPGPLVDNELELTLREAYPGDPRIGWCHSYRFDLRQTGSGELLGDCELRVSNSPYIRLYAGHIAYEVKAEFRGHHYAARACRLMLPLARHHQLDPLWITCNPENLASRRTCELAGAVYIETVPIPPDCDMYQRGERYKCRYRLALP